MTFIFFIVFLLLVGYGGFKVYRSLLNGKLNLLSGVPYAVAGLLALTVGMGFTTVDAGSVGVVKQWGQATRQLQPGAHLLLPFAEEVTLVPVQTRIIKPNEDAASKDLQIVHTEVTLAYHVDPFFAKAILVELNNDAESRVIGPAILEAIKAVTAKYDVQQLIEQRANVRDGIEEMVKARLAPYHIIAETTSITNFSFSQQYEQAIESKVTALQRAEQAQNELNRVKIEAQQQVAQATAQATATVAKAKAEAESLSLQRAQLTPELLQLRAIEMFREKWDGELPAMVVGSGGTVVPMLDMLAARKQAQEIRNSRKEQKEQQ